MIMTASRPVRALALVMVSYVAARVWWLSPVTGYSDPVVTAVPDVFRPTTDGARGDAAGAPGAQNEVPLLPAGAARDGDVRLADALLTARRLSSRVRAAIVTRVARETALGAPRPSVSGTMQSSTASTASTLAQIDPSRGAAQPVRRDAGLPPPLPQVAFANRRRFSGSFFGLLREGGGTTLAPGGLLGGNQAGFRLNYAPGPPGLFLTARASAPLSSLPGQEVAIGAGVRGRNVGLIVEQRIALDRGQPSEAAAIVYGGIYDRPLPFGAKLDAYAQAGVVGVRRQALFVDGAVRAERKIVEGRGWRLGVGAGAWGGAQPGVSRLDVGPQIVARVSAGQTSFRIGGEYRFRIAGDASPANGPALTLGVDF